VTNFRITKCGYNPEEWGPGRTRCGRSSSCEPLRQNGKKHVLEEHANSLKSRLSNDSSKTVVFFLDIPTRVLNKHQMGPGFFE
jgi:hypothetical protein